MLRRYHWKQRVIMWNGRFGRSMRAQSATARTTAEDKIIIGSPVWDKPAPAVVSAYIHLPFCKRRCYYCDFPVVATGNIDRRVVQDRFTSYVEQLCTEIQKQPKLNGAPLQTVFFGGGTPSLIPPEHLKMILRTLDSHIGIAESAEVSMEADPGTFDSPRLRDYMKLGVNRFSIGVQAFSQESLEHCGRSHDLADVYAAIDAVHDASPPSWSLDLISGLPGVTLAGWEATIREATRMCPPHVSVYDLQVEPGTAFERWEVDGTLIFPNENTSADSWAIASKLLIEAGFEHYELSNFAKPGHQCKHNMVYWMGHSYYAFGLGAASYLHGKRFSRPRTMSAWSQYVKELDNDRPAACDTHGSANSTNDRMLEAVMLQLRLVRGLDCKWFASAFGRTKLVDLLRSVSPHVSGGRVVLETNCQMVTDEDLLAHIDRGISGYLRLTDPDGLIVSNDIISDIFVELH